MHWALLAALLASGGIVKEAHPVDKPVCTTTIHGRFWPDAANADAGARRKLAQCGLLEICTDTGRRYKWKPVTVNIRQLGKTPQEPTPACAEAMVELGGK
ncbi:MAG TPA: hypothetical protein VML19_22610 [Verrucomicrobiae bacterium]|nr:hypothetical protein [Verrucomicrobiae bacterium]